jgi:hypothetical protein
MSHCAFCLLYDCSCIWNMNPAEVIARTAPLVRYIRANGTKDAHVILVEGSPAGLAWASTSFWPGLNPGNVALKAQYDILVQAGEQNLHYVRSEAVSRYPHYVLVAATIL